MFEFTEQNLKGLFVIKPKVFSDDRGFFKETYKRSEFMQVGITEDFVQDNHSKSQRGVLRGLHYQDGEHAQGKLVRCVRGEIYDVAVDIRKDSSTFKKWFGILLSEENHNMLYIPVGFAHGFFTLTDGAELVYKTTAEYHATSDRGIIWNDPDIGIIWMSDDPILSEKDKTHPRLLEIR